MRDQASPDAATSIDALSPEDEVQELRETIEVVFQITGQLDVENIVKNVVWSFLSKLAIDQVTFILAKDIDADSYELIHYHGIERADIDFKIPSLGSLIAFLGKEEFSQTYFSSLQEHYKEKRTVQALAQLRTEVIATLRTDRGVNGVVLLPHQSGNVPYTTREMHFVTRILRFAAVALENANLYWQATTDRMTRLYSHHFFQKSLEDEINRAKRLGGVFALVMLDIDHFKQFNDTFGHLQGDTIIKDLSRLLVASTRSIDLCARYGGEEFAIILRGVNLTGAAGVAERLRKRVEGHEFAGRDGPLHVTVSVGVTEFEPEHMRAASEMVAVADKALYVSKEGGRNRVSTLRAASA
jgi:two-component system, cell cycle response regulator